MKIVFRFPHLERCKNITREFLSKPLSILFRNPVDPIQDGLKNYFEIVKKPIDLTTINNKLQKRLYNTSTEWYDDMCLVFQNAIDYYPEESQLSMIAKYKLNEFKKLAIGLNSDSEDKWLKEISKIMRSFFKS